MATNEDADVRTERFTVAKDYRKVDFGIVDHKRRPIGAVITLETANYVAGGARAFWRRAPGTYFEVTCGNARNGYRYGAGQPTHHFATEAEREAFIEKYLKGARARMAKKFGGPK